MMNSSKVHKKVSESHKVDIILQTLYPSVNGLLDWLESLDRSGTLKSTILTDRDHEGYRHFLRTTLVAEKVKTEWKKEFSFTQVSHQQETIVRGIERVLRRDGVGNNVLSLGFRPMTDNPKASVTTFSKIEYLYPSSSFNRLQSGVWKTLLTRIGDALMSHLLENTSIFVLLSRSAVYHQLTGEPIFQLWPYTAGSTYPAKLLSLPQHTRHNNSNSKQNTRSATTSSKWEKGRPCKEAIQTNSQPPLIHPKNCTNIQASGQDLSENAGENVRGLESRSDGRENREGKRHRSQSSERQDKDKGKKHKSRCTEREDQSKRHKSRTHKRQNVEKSKSTEKEDRDIYKNPFRDREKSKRQKDDTLLLHSNESVEEDGNKNQKSQSSDKMEQRLGCSSQRMNKKRDLLKHKRKTQCDEEPPPKRRKRSNSEGCEIHLLERLQGYEKPLFHSQGQAGLEGKHQRCTDSTSHSPLMQGTSMETDISLGSSCQELGQELSTLPVAACSKTPVKKYCSVADSCGQLLQENCVSSSCPQFGHPVPSRPETERGFVDVTVVPFSGLNPAAGKDTNEPKSLSKRQRKRLRAKKNKKLPRPCTPGTRPYQHHRYFPRLSLLYGRSLREKFPNNFTLASYSQSEEDAASLFRDIFLKSDVGGNLFTDNQPCQCQEQEERICSVHSSEMVNSRSSMHSADTIQVEADGCTVHKLEAIKSHAYDQSSATSSQLEEDHFVMAKGCEFEDSATSIQLGEDDGTVHNLGMASSPAAEGSTTSIQVEEEDHVNVVIPDSINPTPQADCKELSQQRRNSPGLSSDDVEIENIVPSTVPHAAEQGSNAVNVFSIAATCVSNIQQSTTHRANKASAGVDRGLADTSVSGASFLGSVSFSAESTAEGCTHTAPICTRSQTLQLLQLQQTVKECGQSPLRGTDQCPCVDTSSVTGLNCGDENGPSTNTASPQVQITQDLVCSTASQVNTSTSIQDTGCSDRAEEIADKRNQTGTVTRDSGENRATPQDVSDEANTFSSDASSFVTCGQKCDDSNSHKLGGSLLVSGTNRRVLDASQQKNARSKGATTLWHQDCEGSSYQSSRLKDKQLEPIVPETSSHDQNHFGDVLQTGVHPSSGHHSESVRQLANSSGQHEILQEKPASNYPLSQTPDASSPSNIFQLPSSLSTTPDSTCTLKSPMDIIVAETPSELKSSADSESSTSVCVSTPTSSAESVRQADFHDHSSFFCDGSLRDRTMANMNATALCLGRGMIQEKDDRPERAKPACGPTVFPEQKGKDGEMEGRDKEMASTVGTEFYTEVLPVLQKLINNHRKCKHWALLEHHCKSRFDRNLTKKRKPSNQSAVRGTVGKGDKPVAAIGWNNKQTSNGFCRKGKQRPPATPTLLEDHIPPGKVFAFLRAVVKQTIPEKLLGSSANMAHLLKSIKTLVSAGKFEKLCLGQLVMGLKTKSCVWLRRVLCPKEKQHRLAQLMWWIVICFIFPLIRAFFYVTDTSTLRMRVLYYRKKTWLRLHMRAMDDFRKATTCKLQSISESKVTELLASGQCLGVSVLRFLPKAKSLRPIVNMSRKPEVNGPQKRSINRQLMRLFDVLTSEKALDSSILGCSVFGIDDVYLKLRQFKESRASRQDDRCLYFVKTDVSKCFDSIDQQLLLSIIRGILTKDGEQTYTTRKYASMRLTGQSLKRVFHTDTKRLANFEADFSSFARQKSIDSKFTDIILVDQALYQQETTVSLLNVLSSHLFWNVIKVGQRHYLQGQGISQGSVVSTLLANLYLAHLETAHLPVQGDELLVRWMDDYLYLTPDRTRAQRFVDNMITGFLDYNCFCNPEKILTSFPVHISSATSTKHTEPDDPFPWCGLLIDTSTLEVSVDYSRYSGLSITDPATFDTSNKAGQTLRSKLLRCMKIKCHAIYFDPVINSRERVLVSTYQMLLFVAAIFHSFVCKLPANRRVDANPSFFIGTVNMIARYLQTLVTKQFKRGKVRFYRFPVQLTALQWLNADAFLKKLHPFPGYRQLKKFLTLKKLSLQRKMKREELESLQEVCCAATKLNMNMLLFS